MRNSKSILAGIAAGALALGALTIASAPAASAKPNAKPKNAVTATASPVRVTFTGTALEAVPYADLSWTTSGTLAATDTVTVVLVTAPNPLAELAIGDPSQIGAGVTNTSGSISNSVANLTLGTPTNTTALTGGGAAALGLASIAVAANAPGTYTGSLTSYHVGVPVDTATFAITTTGKVTSMTITPASQNVAVQGTASMAVKLKDTSGKETQPLVVDGVVTSVAPAGNGTPTAITTTGFTTASLYDGHAVTEFSPLAAGTYAVTATPIGTLPAGGVTPQSATVVATNTSNFTAVNIVAPTKGVSTSNTVYTAPTALTPFALSTVYASTTVKDITFGIAGTAGSTVAYAVTDDAVAPAGVTSGAGTVTLGADGTGTVKVSALAPGAGTSYVVSVGPPAGNQVTYTVSYQATGALNAGNITTLPPAGTTTYVKDGAAQPVSATVTDQFGLPLQGVTVATLPTVSTATSGVTGADGKVTLSIPAPVAGTTSQSSLFSASALGSTVVTAVPIALIYNASGAPTSLTASSTAGTVAATALATQYVDSAGNKTGTWAATSTTTETQWMEVTATVGGGVTGVPVTFTGKDVYFAASNLSTLGAAVKDEATTATVGGVASVFVKATKTGTATITMSAGTLTAPITWNVANQTSDARVLTVTPAAQEATSPAQVKAKVTDAFGNPVAIVGLFFNEEGVGNFAGGTSTQTAITGLNGEVVVDVIASESGLSNVTVIGTGNDFSGAADSPVTGAPKGVSSGTAKITFAAGRTISIVGTRTTVEGKPGIAVAGSTTGFPVGDTVKPFVKFPGQTSYTEGTARPAIGANGKFTWSRKTGKKSYVYFTNMDGKIVSNSVVIPAN